MQIWPKFKFDLFFFGEYTGHFGTLFKVDSREIYVQRSLNEAKNAFLGLTERFCTFLKNLNNDPKSSKS